MKNIIQTKLDAATRDAVNKAVGDLETAVAGKTATLTDDERRRYGSINEQNKLIVNKARDYRQSQPGLSSPDVNWDEFESDYQTRVFIENIVNRLLAVVHDFGSTKILHDYDNVQDTLDDYGYARYKLGAGEAGYDAKVNEYKQFFTKSNKTTSPEGSGGNP